MKRKMHRLLRSDHKVLIVAMDHTAILDAPVDTLANYGETVRKAVEAGADAFLTPVGSLERYADDFGPAAVVASLRTGDQAMHGSVARALSLGADAIKCFAWPFAGDDTIERTGRLAAEAGALGLPLIVESIPGGFGAKDKHTPDLIAAGARIAAESGADMVKTLYPGSIEATWRLVEYASVPVVILGGAVKASVQELFQEVYDAMQAGCAGVAIGKNVWRAPDPRPITQGLAAIVHAGATVDEALAAAGLISA